MSFVKKGDRINIPVTGLGSSGEGVGKLDGFTIFVPGALPNEIVQAKISLSKKNYAVADLLSIEQKSPDRIAPPCPVFKDCGGCQLQHLAYPAQLTIKRSRVIDALERIGHIKKTPVHEVLASSSPWAYRNKMLFAVDKQSEGAVIGCYAKATHAVINATACMIQSEENNVIVSVVREWMNRYEIQPYNEKFCRGLIRNVMGRVGPKTGEVMAGIITTKKNISFLAQLVEQLRARVPKLLSIVQIVKEDNNNVVLAGQEQVLWGQKRISGILNGLYFNISAKSFFQVNSNQAEALYQKALELADISGQENVIEAYSGTGTIGMLFAQKSSRVFGLELSPQAISDAKVNATLNNCKNIEFIQGDVAKTLPALIDRGINADIFVVDPPRAGLATSVVQTIIEAAPEKIIYISCNPASLARDLALLKTNYELQFVQPVDMFPMTSHVEVIVKLCKIK